MSKEKIISLLNNDKICLNELFDPNKAEMIYNDIYDSLIWMDFYLKYDANDGFLQDRIFKSFEKSNKKYYLPHFIDYQYNRCANVYYVYCGPFIGCPLYFSVIINEGNISNLRFHKIYTNMENSDYCDLHKRYLQIVEQNNLKSGTNQSINDEFKMINDMINGYKTKLKINPVFEKHQALLFYLIEKIDNEFVFNQTLWTDLDYWCIEHSDRFVSCIKLTEEKIHSLLYDPENDQLTFYTDFNDSLNFIPADYFSHDSFSS